MIVKTLGHNHIHNCDFVGDFPDGSNGYFVILLKSSAIFRFNGEEVTLPENTVYVYRKGTPRYFRANNEPFSNDWCVFILEDGDEEFLKSINIPIETPIILDNISQLSIIIKSMTYEKYNNNINKDETIRLYMKLFFLKLSDMINTLDLSAQCNLHDRMYMIRAKIYSLPFMKHNIESLSEEVIVSTSYFQHLYKHMFGVSCFSDIINARVEYAKHLLLHTDSSVKLISQSAGYDNDVHFMRQFKKITGKTPSQFRKDNIDGKEKR